MEERNGSRFIVPLRKGAGNVGVSHKNLSLITFAKETMKRVCQIPNKIRGVIPAQK